MDVAGERGSGNGIYTNGAKIREERASFLAGIWRNIRNAPETRVWSDADQLARLQSVNADFLDPPLTPEEIGALVKEAPTTRKMPGEVCKLSAADFTNRQPRPFHWDLTIEAGKVGVMWGPPDVGKSVMAVSVGVARVRGEELYGRKCSKGHTLVASWEDERSDFMDKLEGVLETWPTSTPLDFDEVLSRVHFHSLAGEEFLLVRKSVTGNWEPDLDAIEAMVRTIREDHHPDIDLIFIESAIDPTGGDDSNNAYRAEVTACMRLVKRLKEASNNTLLPTVILVGHPTKADRRAGRYDTASLSGGGALINKSRFGIVMVELTAEIARAELGWKVSEKEPASTFAGLVVVLVERRKWKEPPPLPLERIEKKGLSYKLSDRKPPTSTGPSDADEAAAIAELEGWGNPLIPAQMAKPPSEALLKMCAAITTLMKDLPEKPITANHLQNHRKLFGATRNAVVALLDEGKALGLLKLAQTPNGEPKHWNGGGFIYLPGPKFPSAQPARPAPEPTPPRTSDEEPMPY